MKKIHIWIGFFSKGENEYEQYFNQEELPCQFCKDIDCEEYDEDFIGIIPLFEKKVGVEQLLDEVPIDENEIPKVIEKCKAMNISGGNAIFYMTDASIVIENTEKKYNELKYIGIYDSSL
ncbi:immunity 22 family protein [Capnocytophaga periodontitidis]|nr:immunity 22 family protein [Capnocytophaga periodontitidis]